MAQREAARLDPTVVAVSEYIVPKTERLQNDFVSGRTDGVTCEGDGLKNCA